MAADALPGSAGALAGRATAQLVVGSVSTERIRTPYRVGGAGRYAALGVAAVDTGAPGAQQQRKEAAHA